MPFKVFSPLSPWVWAFYAFVPFLIDVFFLLFINSANGYRVRHKPGPRGMQTQLWPVRGAFKILHAMFLWSHPSHHQLSHWMPTESTAGRTQIMTQVPCLFHPHVGSSVKTRGGECSLGPGLGGGKSSPPKGEETNSPSESPSFCFQKKKKEKTLEKHLTTMTTSSIAFPPDPWG